MEQLPLLFDDDTEPQSPTGAVRRVTMLVLDQDTWVVSVFTDESRYEAWLFTDDTETRGLCIGSGESVDHALQGVEALLWKLGSLIRMRE